MAAPLTIAALPLWELHPPLVHFPIAFFLGAVVLDGYAWWRGHEGPARVATGLLVAGLATGLLAGLTGLLAFFTVPAHTAEAHDRMYWHLGLMLAAVVLFLGVVVLRRGPAPSGMLTAARGLGVVAAVLLLVGAYLGGDLVYHGGAGVSPEILVPELREGHSHGPGEHEHHDQHDDHHHE